MLNSLATLPKYLNNFSNRMFKAKKQMHLIVQWYIALIRETTKKKLEGKKEHHQKQVIPNKKAKNSQPGQFEHYKKEQKEETSIQHELFGHFHE